MKSSLFLPWFERTVEKEKSSKWDSSSYAPIKPIELQLWLLLQKWGANVGSCTSLAIWALLVPPVEDLFIVVHPDLSQTHLVASDHLRAFREGVRTLCAKHVTYDWTGDDF